MARRVNWCNGQHLQCRLSLIKEFSPFVFVRKRGLRVAIRVGSLTSDRWAVGGRAGQQHQRGVT